MKKIMLMLAMLASGMAVSAQSVLDKLVFEAPKKLITAKGKTANVRWKPSLKAPLQLVEFGFDDSPQFKLNNHTLYPVIEDLNGWYKIESYIDFIKIAFDYAGESNYYEACNGYVSKTVVRESPCTESLDSLIAERRNNPIDEDYLSYSYVDLYDYRDLPNGEYEIISTTYNPNYYILTTIYNGFYTLWLGKVVDNVFVFKYPVQWEFECDERVGDRIYPDSSGKNKLYYSEDGPFIHENNRATGFMTIFHFDNFGDGWIERLFKDAIEEQRTGVAYYNAEWIESGYDR